METQLSGDRLPAAARIGRVRLAVSDLAASVRFYRDVIGLTVLADDGALARLGTPDGVVLLELEALPGVRALGAARRLGLYHTAFLLPSRAALASFVQHLLDTGARFGASDHLVSEAIYLVDPEGLTVEVYADRPRSAWRFQGKELAMATDPLRTGELLAIEREPWAGAPVGTTIGHVHFFVGDLEAARRFYHAGLGFDVMVSRYPGALFVAAGGYHHHVGLNTWAAGSPLAGANDARLMWWELVVPSGEDVARLAARLTGGGYLAETDGAGRVAVTDACGIRVALAARGNG